MAGVDRVLAPAWPHADGLRRTFRATLKRAADVAGALTLLALLAPLFAVIAMAIVLTDPGGPVLYRHRRVGKDGRPIDILKFRSMWWDRSTGPGRPYPTAYEAFLDMGRGDLAAEYAAHHKVVDDPRVTPFGRWLRRTSLDELPQLLNALRGDLSLVGPRPVTAGELHRYGARHARVREMRPGITGLWQVSGRSGLSYPQRVALDVFYVEHQSLRLDLSILARTLVSVVTRRGAY